VSGRARGDRRSNKWHITKQREQCCESGPCSTTAHAFRKRSARWCMREPRDLGDAEIHS
jgi:hypothetical protein